MTKKSVTVLFSGGLDSTYLTYSLLSDPKVSQIKLMRVKITNNESKTKVEDMQIPKLLEILKIYDKENKLNHYRDFSSVFEVGVQSEYRTGLHFEQMPFWIMCSLRTVTDEVHIGYVMNDDAVSYLGDMQKIWNSYKCIHDKLPILKFPISKLNKEEIKNRLPNDLFQEVFSCENPNLTIDNNSFIECGNCVSCKKNKYYGFFDQWSRNKNYDTKSSESWVEEEKSYALKYDPFDYKSFDLRKKALIDNSKTKKSSTLKTFKKYAKRQV